MIEQVAKTDFYEMSVDKAKNRYYVLLKGNWERTAQVSGYLADSDKAMRQLSRGFTMLADLTQLGTVSPEVGSLMDGIQMRMVSLGGIKIASLVSNERRIIRTASGELEIRAGLTSKEFTSKAEAEAWLDEK